MPLKTKGKCSSVILIVQRVLHDNKIEHRIYTEVRLLKLFIQSFFYCVVRFLRIGIK
jgi:hypothetical protein